MTNASWEDFWLNEGWTTYAEYRICERLYGREYVELAAVRDRNLLFEDYERFRSTPQFTQLKYPMQGVDPEEVFSRVPYYKGQFLLMLIEQSVGREAFDAFIHGYIQEHAFRSLTTEQFLAYLRQHLPQAFDHVAIEEWIYMPGYPAEGPVFRSAGFNAVEEAAQAFVADGRLTKSQITGWSPDQIVLFLQQLPETLSAAACRQLDQALLLPGILFNIAYPMTLALLLWFARSYAPHRRLARPSFFWAVPAAWGVFLCATFLVSQLIPSIEAYRIRRQGFHLFRLYIVVMGVLALVEFVRAYRSSRSEEDRGQIKWYFIGLAVGLGSYLFLNQLPAVFSDKPLLSESISGAFFFLLPVFMATVMLQFRLLRVNIVFHRGLVYSI